MIGGGSTILSAGLSVCQSGRQGAGASRGSPEGVGVTAAISTAALSRRLEMTGGSRKPGPRLTVSQCGAALPLGWMKSGVGRREEVGAGGWGVGRMIGMLLFNFPEMLPWG